MIVDGPPDAPALLLVNALGTTPVVWDRQVPAFAARFRVIRDDLRGHAATDVPPGPYTIDDLGRDALAVLDRAGVERATVCGVSLGGMVALWLAIHAPKRVERLVPACTSARLGPPEGWTERAALVRRKGTRAVAPSVVDRWLTPPHSVAHPGDVARLRSMVESIPAEGYAGCCEAIRDLDLTPDLSRITAPTVLIAGAHDPATPPDHAERIASAVRGARVALLDAAHLANFERPDEFAALVLGAG